MEIKAFTKHNPRHPASILNWPEEDSFKFQIQRDKISIAVADGITRDPLDLPHLPDIHTLVGEAEFAIEYPIPSPAKKAANLFCEATIKKSRTLKPSIKSVKETLNHANKQIKKLNKENNPKPDYLENDFWACVGAFGFIQKNTLHYGYICDCGIAIFNSEGKLKFITKDLGPTTLDIGIWNSPQLKGKKWSEPEGRKIQRSQFRNNPKEKYSYGAFTGEPSAIKFIQTGKIKLKKDEYAFLFTDGFKPLLISKNFNLKRCFNSLEDYIEKNTHKIGGAEGTLIAVKMSPQ